MITYGFPLTFEPNKAVPVILRNFYDLEKGFVWSKSKWCEIVFPFSGKTGTSSEYSDLLVDFDVFKAPPSLNQQSVFFYLNGVRLGQYDVVTHDTRVISFPTALLKAEDNSLVIDTPQSDSPANHMDGDDTRLLGIQLFSVQIQSA